MTIDAASGLIAWMPVEADGGNHDVTVRVTDGRGGEATQAFVLRVMLLENNPPQITSAPVFGAEVGELYQYDVEATDPDPEDVLSFSLDLAPPGLSIDPQTGLIEWTPLASQAGPAVNRKGLPRTSSAAIGSELVEERVRPGI